MASTFRSAVALAAGAEKAIQRGKRETTKVVEDESKRELKAQERAVKAAQALDAQRARGLFQQYRQQESAAERAAKAEQRARQQTEQSARREIEKTVQSAMRALAQEESATRRANERMGSSFARRTSYRAARTLSAGFSAAGSAIRDVASGMGVDLSLQGAISRGVGIEDAATALSNRGHVVGAPGANGQVVDPAVLAAQARATGKETAVNPEEILGAGRAFVGLTGDLDLWRSIMPDVVRQTKALGGNQEEAAKAAGEFAAHVGDVPNKEKAILDLMRVAAGQGKIGGVDFSDFAKYAAKAAAPASQFAGDKAQNISQLTALAEIAKVHGGANNAADAFTSVASFSNTLNKPTRRKKINALLGDEGQTIDKSNPFQLARALVLAASKQGDASHARVALSAAIGDTRSLKAVRGLQNTFNEAGGGAAGTAAVDAELKKFAGAVQSEDETNRALGVELKTTKSKAEIFNQSLENIATGARDGLAPALEQLEPKILSLVQTLSDVTTWAVQNPKEAIMAAIAVSVARAGIEAALRNSLENAITGGAEKIGVSLTKLSNTFTAASAAIAALYLAKDQADAFMQENGGWEGVKAFLGAGADPTKFGFEAVDEMNNRKAKEEAAGREPKPTYSLDNLPPAWRTPDEQGAPGMGWKPGGSFAGNGNDQAAVDLLKQQHAAAQQTNRLLTAVIDAVKNQSHPTGAAPGKRVDQGGGWFD